MITAACYEHKPLMLDEARRLQLLDDLRQSIGACNAKIAAWVVLPNHYHLLVNTPNLRQMARAIGLIHGRTSRRWNEEDGETGRKCWFRFSDRAVRSDEHYFACLNYIHANPVKHGLVESGMDWAPSSIHKYESELGIEILRDLWKQYPVGTMGNGWDD